MSRNQSLARYAASRNALSRPSDTPWWSTLQGLELLASIKSRPRVKVERDHRFASEHTGPKVRAVELFAFRYAERNGQRLSPTGSDAVGAIWGSPQGVTSCHWERAADITALRLALLRRAKACGFVRLARQIEREIARVEERTARFATAK